MKSLVVATALAAASCTMITDAARNVTTTADSVSGARDSSRRLAGSNGSSSSPTVTEEPAHDVNATPPPSGAPPAYTPPPGGAPMMAPAYNTDPQLELDDFLIRTSATEALVGKMVGQKPNDKNDFRGEVKLARDGSTITTSDFYYTRAATTNDVRVGLEVFYCAGGKAPESRKAAREGAWSHGHITAAADLMTGKVTVDGATVDVSALRVIVAPPLRPQY